MEGVTKQREASIHGLAWPEEQLDIGDDFPGSAILNLTCIRKVTLQTRPPILIRSLGPLLDQQKRRTKGFQRTGDEVKYLIIYIVLSLVYIV